MKNENNKTNIYIDGSNLYLRSKANGLDIDYKKLYIYIQKKHLTDNIFYFLGFSEDNKNLYKELESYNYKLIFRESVRSDKYIKGNCDSEMVLYICRDLYKNNIDEFVLITSDGDFACVVNELIKENRYCKIISPTTPKYTSKLLRKATTNITYIQDIYNHIKRETPVSEDR